MTCIQKIEEIRKLERLCEEEIRSFGQNIYQWFEIVSKKLPPKNTDVRGLVIDFARDSFKIIIKICIGLKFHQD